MLYNSSFFTAVTSIFLTSHEVWCLFDVSFFTLFSALLAVSCERFLCFPNCNLVLRNTSNNLFALMLKPIVCQHNMISASDIIIFKYSFYLLMNGIISFFALLKATWFGYPHSFIFTYARYCCLYRCATEYVITSHPQWFAKDVFMHLSTSSSTFL